MGLVPPLAEAPFDDSSRHPLGTAGSRREQRPPTGDKLCNPRSSRRGAAIDARVRHCRAVSSLLELHGP